MSSSLVEKLRVICQTTTAAELAEWELGHVTIVPGPDDVPTPTASSERLSVSDLSTSSKLSMDSAASGSMPIPNG